MPFLGLGVHVIFALFFAIHAMRTGRNMYWLIILFGFPLLGSIVYFFVEFVPDMRLERAAKAAGNRLLSAVDPSRDVRAARDAFEATPTAENETRLALALLDVGDAAAADQHFRNCLAGPFGTEADVRVGAARTALVLGNYKEAARLLQAVRVDTPSYRPEDILILLGQTHWAMGDLTAARVLLEDAARLGGFDAQAEYLIFALETDDVAAARRIQKDLDLRTKRLTRHARKLHAPMQARVLAAWTKSGHAPHG